MSARSPVSWRLRASTRIASSLPEQMLKLVAVAIGRRHDLDPPLRQLHSGFGLDLGHAWRRPLWDIKPRRHDAVRMSAQQRRHQHVWDGGLRRWEQRTRRSSCLLADRCSAGLAIVGVHTEGSGMVSYGVNQNMGWGGGFYWQGGGAQAYPGRSATARRRCSRPTSAGRSSAAGAHATARQARRDQHPRA